MFFRRTMTALCAVSLCLVSGPPACGDNLLVLDVEDTSLYVKPTEPVVIDMDVLNLLQPVTGCQAVLNFDSTYFGTGGGDLNIVAGGGDWSELIYTSWTVDGDLDVAVGVTFSNTLIGTQADNTTAVITLDPISEGVKVRVVGVEKLVIEVEEDVG